VGELWENYVVSERYKRLEYKRQTVNSYFWRAYDKKEIDLVEEQKGELSGYEIKWKNVPVKIPRDWKASYPTADFSVIHRENYLEFIQ
jgi:predicted AAA+ superfamily ATPase